MNIYDFSIENINGNFVSLKEYEMKNSNSQGIKNE